MNSSKKTPLPVDTFPLVTKTTSPEEVAEIDFSKGAVFLLDKPPHWTSFRPVGLIRKLINIKKVGHAGTLDPMATGLLVLCTGKATKSISLIQDGQKEYVSGVQFGSSTPSYDAETEADAEESFEHITTEKIQTALDTQFTGEIQQKPPIYSAIKVKGERLYKLARRGEEVEIKSRAVHVHENEIISYEPETGRASIRIVCGKGTYIRSIAHDLGITLGSRAHLCSLRRTKTGSYSVNEALTVHELVSLFNAHDDINLS